MKLLEAQPEIAPGAPPAPPVGTSPEDPAADPGARSCKSGGATMAPGQDWCLSCGTAAGRIGSRPGVGPAMTVFGLTALLVAGAGAASFSAPRQGPAGPPAPGRRAPPAPAPAAPPEPERRRRAGPPGPSGGPAAAARRHHAAGLDDDHAG